MPSKRQKNAGRIIPDPVTGYELICVTMKIPNVLEYRIAFRDAVFQLMKQWNWERSGAVDDRRAAEAATYWKELILEHLKFFECPNPCLEEDCGCEDDCDDCEDC